MRMPAVNRLRGIGQAVLVFAALAAFTGAQADDTQQALASPARDLAGFALTYDVYSGGFRALRLDFEVDVVANGADAPRYDTNIKMETSGIIGALFNWRFDATSTGAWRDGNIVPERYRTANVWRGNEREVAIDYEDGVANRVSANPPYSEEDMKKVGPDLIPGAIDPTSAVTALVLTSAIRGECRPETAIYDGRRRYDAKMQSIGSRALKTSSFAPFSGEAEGCKLTFKRIAGFRPDRKRMQNLEVDVWLANVGVEAGRVPVRLELETPWGKGFGHLVRARNADGALVFGEAE